MSFCELSSTVQNCLERLRRWQAPPHWSWSDWQEEVTAHAQSAAWEALNDYDSGRGVPLSAFVHVRVITRVLTRYRQEWTYAVHCACEDYEGEPEKVTQGPHRFLEDHTYFIELHESVRHALILLSPDDRWLINQLFWAQRTESEIAQLQGISQPAISKRKRAILRNLRSWIDTAEKS